MKKLLYVVNNDHFFLSHRINIAQHALKNNYDVHVVTNFTKYKKKNYKILNKNSPNKIT